jgi:hypothetical protein
MKTTLQRLRAGLAACAATLLLMSCGGVGQDGTGAAPPDTRTTGVVNGFGSVVVNGIHFDVSHADISIDGLSGRTQADLRVGMVVDVNGTVAADGASGTATSLTYESLVRGTIDAPLAGGSVQVLGQRITIDDTTVFDGAGDATELQPGDRLQVSGFRDADGNLRATWVSRESGSGELQLTGFVAAASATSVRVAGLDIAIANADLGGASAASLAPGQLVRVVLEAPPANGAAVARKLRIIDTRIPDALSKLQLQGIVAQWDASTGRFKLFGQQVQVNATTQFVDGSVADLANGTRVEVTGALGADKLLVASKLKIFGSVATGYGRGKVTSVDAAGKRFTLLDSVDVRVRAETLLNDTSGITPELRLNNLRAGDEVLVLGVASGSRVDAVLVQRLPPVNVGSGVGGAVTAINGSTLTVLGIAVTANALTAYRDAQGAPVSQSAFLASLQVNDLVRAEGLYSRGSLSAVTVRRVR